LDIGPEGGALVRHDVSEGARWRASGGAPEIWLLWVDTGYRTAALGTPDGSFGMILDRSATGGTDRIAAARDIFDWFGYDLTKLQETQR
jgi:apolipoprotein D and lipocalin family protein